MENNQGLLVAICHVTFDITEGQQVDSVYPPAALSSEEKEQIAFHAFPDSLSYELHATSSLRDASFTFCIPRIPAAGTNLYASVLCRTTQAPHLPRGGEQRSVVVLSLYPLTSLLTSLASFSAPLVFNYGEAALEQVYTMVKRWPSFSDLWDQTDITLPLGHSSISCQLPALSTLPPVQTTQALEAAVSELDDATGLPLCLLPQAYGQQELIRGLYSDVDVFTPLAAALPHLWTLWEMVLTAQPLLVLSPTPTACSQTVLALVSLATPFHCGTGVRPFFSLHDPAFAKFAEGGLPDAENNLPFLLGGTNPYLVKALTHWPNILSTGYTPVTQSTSWGEFGGPAGSSDKSSHAAGNGRRFGLSRFIRRPQGPQSLLANPDDAVWFSHTPLVKPSKVVLDSLVQPNIKEDSVGKKNRIAMLNTTILKQHFQELTRAVLFPLLRYITPLQAPTDLGRLQQVAAMPEFNPEAVIASINKKNGAVPEVLSQHFENEKTLVEFYRRFLANPAVLEWVHERRVVAEEWQKLTWQAAWASAGGDEVTAIEEYHRLEVQVIDSAGDTVDEMALVQLQAVFKSLPSDLQQALLLNEERATLLRLK